MKPLLPQKVVLFLLCLFVLNVNVVADDWFEVRSKNFTLVGNAGDKDIRRVATRLEQYREALRLLFPKANFEKSTPTVVYVFTSHDSFREFKPRYKGKIRDNVAGYFIAAREQTIIALTEEERGVSPYEAIFHEYQHFLLENNMDDPPLWLNEGLAEFYSTFRMDENNQKFRLGAPIARHLYTLRERDIMPLEKLFEVRHGSKEYNESSKAGIFYAQSWAFLHYLMMGNERKRLPQLTAFINNLNSGKPIEENFKQSFGADYETLEKELRKYVQKYTYPVFDITLNQQLDFEKTMQSRQMTRAESETQLGILLWHLRELKPADERLQKAVSLDEKLSLPHSWLGYSHTFQSRFDEADKSFAKAIELNPQNYLAYSFRGFLNIRRNRYDEALNDYKKAVELQPNSGRRHAELAAFYAAKGEDVQAYSNYSKAMRLEPRESAYFRASSIIALRLRYGFVAGLQAQTYLRLKGWDNDHAPYAALISYFGFRTANDTARTAKILNEATARVDGTVWASSIFKYLRREISAEDLLKLADNNDKQTEAHAYIGFDLLIDGKKDEALPHYHWVRDNGNRNFIEYGLVLAELKRLEKPAQAAGN